jgi:hypothetical protein
MRVAMLTGLEQVCQDLLAHEGVSDARMFGSNGLSFGGKYFLLSFKGDLVIKLPRARADNLVVSGTGTYFDPGHGRKMRQWITVPSSAEAQWPALAREALDFAKNSSA